MYNWTKLSIEGRQELLAERKEKAKEIWFRYPIKEYGTEWLDIGM